MLKAFAQLKDEAEADLQESIAKYDAASDRGFYDQLAFEPCDKKVCFVKQFKSVLQSCLADAFEGYKGGMYRYNLDTPVWVSRYGEVSGMGITAVKQREGKVILEVSEID